MRKLLVALMIVAFAATAFAEVTLSGSYFARGSYFQNAANMDKDTDDKNMYYDHDFDLWINAKTDKNTFFKAKLELVDEQWGTTDGANVSANPYNAQKGQGLETLALERAWLGHNFGAVTVEAGLMNGGSWGYAFGNKADGKYRVKATIPAGPGNLMVFVQKNKETNFLTTDRKDADADDSDTYYLGYKGKFGGLTVAPLFYYVADGLQDADGDGEKSTMAVDLAIGGNFGAIGFEFEGIYKTTKSDDSGANEPTEYSLYANVFGKVAAAKVGFITAYENADEDEGGNGNGALGEDFDDRWLALLGDWEAAPMVTTGVWANGIYADYAVNEKLSLTTSLFYIVSNLDNNDSTAIDFEVGASYAITEALSYNINAGYATVDLDSDLGDDPDPAMYAQHYLAISF